MKVLVTGATGFIGNYVVEELLKSGHEIVATSRNKDKAINSAWWSKVKYVECDLDSGTDFFSVFNSPEIVIHLAWDGLADYSSSSHFEKTLFVSYSFLKNMIESGVKDIVVLGTCLEYGLQSGCLTENLSTKPVTAYGLAKDTLRKFIEALQEQYEFNLRWIRLFYVYGKNQGRNTLYSQLESTVDNNEKIFNMSGGEQLRDYLQVEKAAEYIASVALQNDINGIINCCSNKPISVRKFVEDYLQRRKSEMKLNLGYYPYAEYEPMAFWGDDTKLKNIMKEKI